MAEVYSFNAFAVLGIYPDDLPFQCVGYAPSARRKCQNRIREDNIYETHRLLKELGRLNPRSRRAEALLRELAVATLCVRNHQYQNSEMVRKWLRILRRVAPIAAPARLQVHVEAVESLPTPPDSPVAISIPEDEQDDSDVTLVQQTVDEIALPSPPETPPRQPEAPLVITIPLADSDEEQEGEGEDADDESEVERHGLDADGDESEVEAAGEEAEESDNESNAASDEAAADDLGCEDEEITLVNLPSPPHDSPQAATSSATAAAAAADDDDDDDDDTTLHGLDLEPPLLAEQPSPTTPDNLTDRSWPSTDATAARATSTSPSPSPSAPRATDFADVQPSVRYTVMRYAPRRGLCLRAHAPRQSLPGVCAACGAPLGAADELVWCKAACGRNVHAACWRQRERECAARGAAVAVCCCCGRAWAGACEHDAVPPAMVEEGAAAEEKSLACDAEAGALDEVDGAGCLRSCFATPRAWLQNSRLGKFFPRMI